MAGQSGRVAGIPNRDKGELRALLQERVHEYTLMRRQQDEVDGLPAHEAQVVVEDYDPVVALALVAVDRRSSVEHQIACNSQVAQYTRPKLKSVEVTTDPEAAETLAARQELSAKLLDLLVASATAKKNGATPPEPVVT